MEHVILARIEEQHGMKEARAEAKKETLLAAQEVEELRVESQEWKEKAEIDGLALIETRTRLEHRERE